MRNILLAGVGSYLPEKILTNTELSQTLDTSDDWIVTRTGIRQRHIAAPKERTSDLALMACKRALENAQMDSEEIDLLIVATATPDHTFPATAAAVQAKLGITKGMAFDIAAVCSGFIFALATADAYLRQGLANTALVVGAETLSRLIDWDDRSTAILFGDGAGAFVLKADSSEGPRKGLLGHVLHTDGRGYDLLKVSGGPSSSKDVGIIQMNGREVFKNAVLSLGSVAEEVLKKCQITPDEVQWMVPHQANTRIIEAVLERLGFPLDKAIFTIDQHANTSSASIPLAFDWGVREGKICRGDLVLMEAFAAGFSWGATVLRF
jgi:3-oxoacyl-[acyl-carrier-protein] synthase-3